MFDVHVCSALGNGGYIVGILYIVLVSSCVCVEFVCIFRGRDCLKEYLLELCVYVFQ